ncbi:hypothetical protein CEXT_367711 [Caerostris extrusa]|uniref:Uncharacterized protein n=1 Tax=Caerostris extrusa TaxID=172846 RepID=A0AAV4NW85_CAEEX|nr:hypothetical protein CEXT_367711 [Caerostris extrusa]
MFPEPFRTLFAKSISLTPYDSPGPRVNGSSTRLLTTAKGLSCPQLIANGDLSDYSDVFRCHSCCVKRPKASATGLLREVNGGSIFFPGSLYGNAD